MKLNRLEAHDRLEYFKKDQSANVFQGAEDCLNKNSLSLALQERSPYVYLFAHPRTADDGVTKIMFWQPRLTKPEAQQNSYLFRAKSRSDVLEICWLIPPSELWSQYEVDTITQHDLVRWSIDQYVNNKKNLEAKDPDDFTDEKIRHIYRELHQNQERKKLMNGLYLNH